MSMYMAGLAAAAAKKRRSEDAAIAKSKRRKEQEAIESWRTGGYVSSSSSSSYDEKETYGVDDLINYIAERYLNGGKGELSALLQEIIHEIKITANSKARSMAEKSNEFMKRAIEVESKKRQIIDEMKKNNTFSVDIRYKNGWFYNTDKFEGTTINEQEYLEQSEKNDFISQVIIKSGEFEFYPEHFASDRYINHLKNFKENAKYQVEALREEISKLNSKWIKSKDVKARLAELHDQLAFAEKSLDKYSSEYNAFVSIEPDVKKFAIEYYKNDEEQNRLLCQCREIKGTISNIRMLETEEDWVDPSVGFDFRSKFRHFRDDISQVVIDKILKEKQPDEIERVLRELDDIMRNRKKTKRNQSEKKNRRFIHDIIEKIIHSRYKVKERQLDDPSSTTIQEDIELLPDERAYEWSSDIADGEHEL